MARNTFIAFALATCVMQSSKPFTRVKSAMTSGFTEPTELVVRDQQSLVDAWSTLSNGIAGNPAPTIDLTRKTVVILALGTRNSGGYAIKSDSVAAEGGNATVFYTVTTPGPDCMTSQIQTSPVDIISFDRVRGDVRFKQHNVVGKC